MDTNTRTLGSVINSNQQPSSQNQSQQSQHSPQAYSTFLTIFSINLAHRLPDLTNVDEIDADVVRNVAELSFGCARIAQETWDELTQVSDVRRQRIGSRQSRVAS